MNKRIKVSSESIARLASTGKLMQGWKFVKQYSTYHYVYFVLAKGMSQRITIFAPNKH